MGLAAKVKELALIALEASLLQAFVRQELLRLPQVHQTWAQLCVDLSWTGTGASRGWAHLWPQTIWQTVCPDPL